MWKYGQIYEHLDIVVSVGSLDSQDTLDLESVVIHDLHDIESPDSQASLDYLDILLFLDSLELVDFLEVEFLDFHDSHEVVFRDTLEFEQADIHDSLETHDSLEYHDTVG